MKIAVSPVLAFFLLIGLLDGCTSAPATAPTSVPPASTAMAAATATFRPTPSPTLAHADPVDGLNATLEVSDPKSPTYDPNSSAYAAFPQVVKKLAAANSPENNAASMLAYALTFPRPDSTLAAQALISLGPDWTMTTAPILFDALLDPRPRVRLYAVLALGTVGKQGSCAVGKLAPLLWDTDAYVRSATAQALSSLTGKNLLPAGYAFTPRPFSANPVPADTPVSSLSGLARQWWNEQGAKINWHPGYDLCDP